jgi:hypothetical protein
MVCRISTILVGGIIVLLSLGASIIVLSILAIVGWVFVASILLGISTTVSGGAAAPYFAISISILTATGMLIQQ